MKPRSPFFYSLILSFSIITFSCKKENKTYPTIEIKEPQPGETFGYHDTVRVKALFTNRDGNVAVQLMQGSSVINIDREKVFDNGHKVDFRLYFDKPYLETGEYDLQVSAFNGSNKRSEFLEISFEELPRKRTGLVALSGNGDNAWLTLYNDKAGISSLSLQGDYSFLTFNGYQQTISVAPVFDGRLRTFDTLLVQQYEVPQPTLPGLRQYNLLTSDKDLTYSYEQEGYIRGWTASGTAARNVGLPLNHIPLSAVFNETRMLVCIKEAGAQIHKVLLLNPVNGAVLKEKNLSGRAVEMLYLGQSGFLLAVKKDGNTELVIYNPVNNTLTSFDKIKNEVPQCLVALEGGDIVLSTDQRIYKLNPLTSVLPSVLYNFAAAAIEYDPTNKEMFYARDFKVYKSAPGDMPQSVLSLNDSIKEIKITYNK